jgi:hypothetical protein
MRSDPQEKLSATSALSLADLKNQFGEVGLRNGPRTGARKRSTVSNEAFLARRLILQLATSGELKFPISVDHVDRPDFRIVHGNAEFLLEVTEACPEADGRKFAKQVDGVQPIGNYSETGLERAQFDILEQIQKSIDEKCSKDYAKNGDLNLLIYPNSEASVWVNFFERSPKALFAHLDARCLKAIYIFWGRRFINVGSARE